jgi:hypothetical protein
MGRHSSLQVFSDVNTKVVSGYKETDSNKRVKTDKVENVQGSCAGAGSGEFQKYLHARKREQDRLEELEINYKKTEEEKAFFDRVQKNLLEDELRTKKNAEKRKRKKEKKIILKSKYIKSEITETKISDIVKSVTAEKSE